MTWEELIEGIELELSHSKPSGDTELEKAWVLQQLLLAKRTILPAFIYKNKDVPPVCLTPVLCQHVKSEQDCEQGCPKKQYLEIPEAYTILEMTDDYGCWAVTFPNGKQIDRRFNYTHATLTANLPVASYIENFGWYRVGRKIYLTNGTQSANFPPFSTFTLLLIVIENGDYETMKDNQINAPDEVIDQMKEYTLRKAYMMMAGQPDINAQGQDDASVKIQQQ